MTVAELIQALLKLKPDDQVVLGIGTHEAESFTVEVLPDDGVVVLEGEEQL